jgi:hypothetical protein
MSRGRSRWMAALVSSLIVMAIVSGSAAAAGWTTTQIPGPPGELFLLNVSCPTANFCAASGSENLVVTSTDPTGGPGAWNPVFVGDGRFPTGSVPAISGRQIQGISCPSEGLCVAVSSVGQIYASTDPTGPGSAWSVTEPKPTGENLHFYGVSCPTEALCVAVTGRRSTAGRVFTSTDPTGGVGAWQEADLGEGFDLRAVSCSSATFCVAAGASGELVASSNPTGGATAWGSIGAPGGPGILQSIACVTGLCLTGNTGGNLLAAAEPASLPSWRSTNGGGSVQITGATCASASACLAVDNNGNVIVSTDPAGARPGWVSTNVRPYSESAEEFASPQANGLFGASCPTVEFCALVGSRGAILTSTEPFSTPAATKPAAPGAPKAKGGPAAPRGPLRPRVKIARMQFRSPHAGRATTDLRQTKLLLRFYAVKGPVRRFECSLDRHRFRPCRSPKRYPKIGHGKHQIAVRAIGSTGRPGPPATKRFYVGHYCPHGHALCFGGVTELR